MSTTTRARRQDARAHRPPQVRTRPDCRLARGRAPAPVRMDLVDRVRRQIAEGRYGISRKLDISLDLVLARLGH